MFWQYYTAIVSLAAVDVQLYMFTKMGVTVGPRKTSICTIGLLRLFLLDGYDPGSNANTPTLTAWTMGLNPRPLAMTSSPSPFPGGARIQYFKGHREAELVTSQRIGRERSPGIKRETSQYPRRDQINRAGQNIFKQEKLYRLREKKFSRESYSLSESFQE